MTWKEIDYGAFSSASIAEGLQQHRAERDIPVSAAFSLPDVNHHPLAVDIPDLESGDFCSAHACRVERHQQGAMEEGSRSINHLRDFIFTEDDRQALRGLRVTKLTWRIVPLQSVNEKESHSGDVLPHSEGRLLEIAKQVKLELADLFRSQLIGRSTEVGCELFQCMDIGICSTPCVISALEFIEHDVCEYIKIGGRIDYVLHFASPASPVDYLKYPIKTLKVGSLGTHNTLGLAKAHGAVNITASHNPPTWNGFKVRADYAGAIAPEGLKQIESLIRFANHDQVTVGSHSRSLEIDLQRSLESGSSISYA
jgi:hypothetical protein